MNDTILTLKIRLCAYWSKVDLASLPFIHLVILTYLEVMSAGWLNMLSLIHIFTYVPYSHMSLIRIYPPLNNNLTWLPRWLSGKESACQCRRCKRCVFNPWVGKIPWRRKWHPTPVFLPGKSHEQGSLAGNSPWGHKESDRTEHTALAWKKCLHGSFGIQTGGCETEV